MSSLLGRKYIGEYIYILHTNTLCVHVYNKYYIYIQQMHTACLTKSTYVSLFYLAVLYILPMSHITFFSDSKISTTELKLTGYNIYNIYTVKPPYKKLFFFGTFFLIERFSYKEVFTFPMILIINMEKYHVSYIILDCSVNLHQLL